MVNCIPKSAGILIARITVSIGVATYPVDDEEDFIIRTPNDAENLIMKADVALRQAKQAGRNQIIAYKRTVNLQETVKLP